jgi:predicted amidophosphoribosyltransferase
MPEQAEPGPHDRGAFVWPPRAVDPRELGPPAEGSGYWKWNPRERPLATVEELADEGDPFATDLEEPRDGPDGPVDARWMVRALERELLGRTMAPLAERRIEAFDASRTCPRCGGVVGPYEAGDRGCPGCVGRRLPWDAAAVLGPWRDGLRRAILDVKFRRAERLGQGLGRRLAGPVADVLAGLASRPGPIVIVPVPMPASRRFERGIDHAGAIAHGLAAGLGKHAALRDRGVSVVPLLRARPGPTQLDVTPAQRARNMRGRFGDAMFGWGWNAGRRGAAGLLWGPCWRSRGVLSRAGVVVLVDDVRTTGATMLAAGRRLRAMLRQAKGGSAAAREAKGVRGPRRAERPMVVAAWTAVVPPRGRGEPPAGELSPNSEDRVREGGGS